MERDAFTQVRSGCVFFHVEGGGVPSQCRAGVPGVRQSEQSSLLFSVSDLG